MALLAAAVLWPSIALLPFAGRPADDQSRFHEHAVRVFAGQWPRFDLSDYASATTPGYHLALAALVRTLGPDTSRHALQFAGSLFTIALVAALAMLVWCELRAARSAADHAASPARGARADTARAIAACLPALASAYVWASGVFLLPDNASWLGMLGVLSLALARVGGWVNSAQRVLTWGALSAAALLLLVFTRQNLIWTAGLLVGAAYLAPASWTSMRRDGGSRWPRALLMDGSLGALFVAVPRRLLASALALAACVPAVLMVAYFADLWHGLVPPRFQDQHAGANPATPALMLALLAIYSVFFGGFILEPLVRLWRERKWLVILAGVIGLLLAVIPETTYLFEPRGSGLWNLVRAMESRGIVIGGHTSPLLVILTPIGAVAFCGWIAMVPTARRWLMLAAFVGFMAAQTANTNAWQRYIEPGWLMLLAVASTWGWHSSSERAPRIANHSTALARTRFDLTRPAALWRWIGPLALAAILALVTIADVRRAKVIPTWEQRQEQPASTD